MNTGHQLLFVEVLELGQQVLRLVTVAVHGSQDCRLALQHEHDAERDLRRAELSFAVETARRHVAPRSASSSPAVNSRH